MDHRHRVPRPRRDEGGRYLLVSPGYDGPLPDGGFHVAGARTTRVLYDARAFLTNINPKPNVEGIKKTIKISPYTPEGYGRSIATALEGKVRIAANPPIPSGKFWSFTLYDNQSRSMLDTPQRYPRAGRAIRHRP